MDICKCSGEKDGIKCPFLNTCYRFKAPTGMIQSFFIEAPFKKDDDGKISCDRYWKDED